MPSLFNSLFLGAQMRRLKDIYNCTMHAGLMFVFVCVCDGVALVATVAIGDQLDYRREGRGDGG